MKNTFKWVQLGTTVYYYWFSSTWDLKIQIHGKISDKTETLVIKYRLLLVVNLDLLHHICTSVQIWGNHSNNYTKTIMRKLFYLSIYHAWYTSIHTRKKKKKKKTCSFLESTIHSSINSDHSLTQKGYCTPNYKFACFVLYLKIINTFFWKIIHAS